MVAICMMMRYVTRRDPLEPYTETRRQLLELIVVQVPTETRPTSMQRNTQTTVSNRRIKLDGPVIMRDSPQDLAITRTNTDRPQVIKNKSLVVRRCPSQ